jgi:hypothetical protein
MRTAHSGAPSDPTWHAPAGPLQEPTGQLCQVFISHAEEQREGFVDFLLQEFRVQYPALQVVLQGSQRAPRPAKGHPAGAAFEDAFVCTWRALTETAGSLSRALKPTCSSPVSNHSCGVAVTSYAAHHDIVLCLGWTYNSQHICTWDGRDLALVPFEEIAQADDDVHGMR